MHAGQQRGGAGEQAVHETYRGRGPGQRLQQRDHPVRGHELHDHQVHRERGQVRPVADRAGPGPLGSGGGVGPPASAARHLVLVVLGDPYRDLRDLVGLVGVDHAQIPRLGQVGPAVAAPLGEPVAAFVRVVGPRQMCTRRAGLLAPRPRRVASATLLLRRRRLTRVVVVRGRARGVARVTRQQMLQPSQLRRQRLVDLHQLRELPGHFRDLPILRRELPGLAGHHDDQLIARHLLRRRHRKIQPHPRRSPNDRHAHGPRALQDQISGATAPAG